MEIVKRKRPAKRELAEISENSFDGRESSKPPIEQDLEIELRFVPSESEQSFSQIEITRTKCTRGHAKTKKPIYHKYSIREVEKLGGFESVQDQQIFQLWLSGGLDGYGMSARKVAKAVGLDRNLVQRRINFYCKLINDAKPKTHKEKMAEKFGEDWKLHYKSKY